MVGVIITVAQSNVECVIFTHTIFGTFHTHHREIVYSEIGRRGRICGCYSKFNMMGIKVLQSMTPCSSDAVFTHIQFTLGERQIIATIYSVISALSIYGSSTFLYSETNFPSSLGMMESLIIGAPDGYSTICPAVVAPR